MNPQFPLYIVSKGRWESRHTSKHLEAMGVPYYIVVEEQELEQYRAVIDPKKILMLHPDFKSHYDTFSDLGAEKGTGSGPARNFAGWHSREVIGAPWHWVMDDNINGFFRFHKNLKTPVSDGTIFRCMEDFVLRYTNVAMAGPQYFMFVVRKKKWPPFVLNTRIYSCNLIRNDLGFEWRGRYNEDTDLSLRMLKAGYCTVLFNAFLQHKMQTGKVKGGNQEIYSIGTAAKSQMLVDMHPDVARRLWRYGRDHHYVDYTGFQARNRLIRKPGLILPEGPNDYGMTLRLREAQDAETPPGAAPEGV